MSKKSKLYDFTGKTAEEVVDDFMLDLQNVSDSDYREPKFRTSSMPFCPILFSMSSGHGSVDYGSQFYFSVGTVLHELIQNSASRGRVGSRILWGDWKCTGCKKIHHACHKPKELCKCGKPDQFSPRQNKGGEREWLYEEVTIEYKGLSGHIDGIVEVAPNKYWIIDFKCLTGGTMLSTSKGFLEMRELGFKKGQNDYSITLDSHEGRKEVTHSFKKKAETVAIQTFNGFALEGTPIHPVLVFTKDLDFKWTKLKDLSEGDWIVSTSNLNDPIWPETNKVSVTEAKLLGWITANGAGWSADARNTPYFHTKDLIIAEKYKSAVQEVTGNPITKTYDGEVPAYTANPQLHFMLEQWEITPKNAAQKSIPRVVRESSKEVLQAFLSSYFECDSGSGNGGVTLTSASKKLCKQLHTILWHGFGILGRKYRTEGYAHNSDNPTVKPYWHIDISGEDCLKFLETFPESKVNKAHGDELRRVNTRVRRRPDTNRHYVPYVAGQHWNAIWDNKVSKKSVVFPDGTVDKSQGLQYFPRLQRGTGMSKDHTKQAGKFADFDPRIESFNPKLAKVMRKIEEENIHFERVVSIKKGTKKKWVYDVTVPNGHCFTANGLASHNTTGNKGGIVGDAKYPYRTNVLQISVYTYVMRERYNLNVVGWSLVYVDRAKPVRNLRDYKQIPHFWTKDNHERTGKKLAWATAAAPLARKIQKRLFQKHKMPTKEEILEIAKSRPCKTEAGWKAWMKAGWERVWGFDPDAKKCSNLKFCLKGDSACAKRITKQYKELLEGQLDQDTEGDLATTEQFDDGKK